MGRWYLCYLVPSRSQLSIVKFDYSNNSDDIVFGKMMNISAKDAVTIPHLHMLAILEHTSNVVLYSGLTVIGKLHIGGALAQHVPSPFAVKKKFFNSPFPRRSSLLPTSTPVDPRFDEHLLSPVLPATRQSANTIMQLPEIGDVRVVLSGLKDAIDNRMTLQYSDGSCYRVTLPNMVYSQLVEDCLNALRVALPRDLVMTTLSRWYAARNLPGSLDISHEEEWTLFTKMLFELLGYAAQNEQKTRRSAEHTPCSAQVKRQRQSLDGTVLDWNCMRKNNNLEVIDKYLQFSGDCEKIPRDNPQNLVNTPGNVLFSHVCIIHYVLHLVYEDLKLNTLRKADLSLLAVFLAQISTDLGLVQYTMHYWKDFPLEVIISDEKRDLIDMRQVTKWPHIPDTPTDIMAYIQSLCLETDKNIDGYPVIDNINTRSKNIVKLLATYLMCDADTKVDKFLRVIAPPGSRNTVGKSEVKAAESKYKDVTCESEAEKVVIMMIEMNITTRSLETYPLAVNFVLYDALWRCRFDPPTDWPAEAYNLLQRPDLASQSDIIKTVSIHNLKNI